jgi:hypothetical protein
MHAAALAATVAEMDAVVPTKTLAVRLGKGDQRKKARVLLTRVPRCSDRGLSVCLML